MALQGRQQCVGAGQEDAGVPQHLAAQQQLLRALGVGLFDEASDGMAAVGAGGTLFDVAVARAREGRQHTEGDDRALAGGVGRTAHHLREGAGVGDVMIRRAEQHQLRRIDGMQGGYRHGGRSVAGARLQHDGAGELGAAQRVAQHETVVFGADQHGAGLGVRQRRHPLQGEREQALAVDQRHELLGKRLARQRPQPRAGATTQDDGLDGGGSGHSL